MDNIDPEEPASPAFFSQQIRTARRFVLDLRPRDQRGLAVVCGGLEVCESSFHIRRKTFPYLAIEFVVGGRGTVRFGDAEHPLRPGSVFGYGLSDEHEIVTDPHDTLVKYFVDFTFPKGSRSSPLPWPRRKVGCVSDILAISRLLDELIHSGLRDSRHSRGVCSLLLESVLLSIDDLKIESTEREAMAFGTYERCRRILEEQALKLKSLDELSEACAVSREYLCRLFKRFDRMSPHQRLLRLKMNYAATRLRKPGTLVKQVSAELGFADPFHFSRVFRSCFQTPPSRFPG